ncbi:MAG: hypothetical protein JW727_04625 [Candidatus Aenigmarchaeota archaeon]|nr:hypothetical protein [Candidatus Aenigmarchaeota archaeon]
MLIVLGAAIVLAIILSVAAPVLDLDGADSSPVIVLREVPEVSGRYEVSSGWTVTSYQNLDERLYSGKKVEVFDEFGNSLGFYREDFLEQAMVDGSGKGDEINNSGQYLHYDYQLDDGKTYYLEKRSIGAYQNELVPWTGDKPSVAVNPPLPKGTEIIFLDLGKDSANNEPWVNELLESKVFHTGDTFHGEKGKKIDVYVGMQSSVEQGPESFLMRNVTIMVRYPG